MADDYIITYTLKLEPGNVVSASGALGKQSGDAFAGQFSQAQIDLSKMFKADQTAKTIVSQLHEGLAKANFGEHLSKSLPDFGRQLERTVQEAVKKPLDAVHPPSARAPEGGHGAEPTIAQQLHPLVSGLEAFSMLLRGAPLLSVAQMVGQAVTGLQELRRTRAAAEVADAIEGRTGGGGPIFLPGRRAAAPAAAETAEARMERRLQGIPGTGTVPAQPGLMTRLTPAATAVAATGGVVAAVTEIDKILLEAAKHAAETNLNFHDMAETLGLSSEEFAKMETKWSLGGVNFQEFGHTFLRVAVQAQRAMPAIRREVEDSDNKVIESAFKVIDAERNVVQAREHRVTAGDKLKTAEGELARFDATRAQERQQQAEAAQLAVSGAQIGARGAEMQRRQAAIAVQFAPQEAAFADVQGKQTVEGARLGAVGARIGLAEARARFEGRDPGQDEELQDRKKRHALQVAIHNRDQAELHEKEARVAEDKRQAAVAAGVGPEAQAQQQLLAVTHAKEQADLHVRQTRTAEINLEYEQRYTPLAAERNKKLFEANQADRGVDIAEQQQVTARITAERAKRDLDRMKYTEIPSVKMAIESQIAGKPQEGYEFGQVPRDVMQKTLYEMGAGQAGKSFDMVGEFMRAMPGKEGEHTPERMRILADFLGGGRGGMAQAQKIGTALLTEPEHRTPEEQKKLDDADKAYAEERDASRARSEKAMRDITLSQQRVRRGEEKADIKTTGEILPDVIKRTEGTAETLSTIKGGTIAFLNASERLNTIISNAIDRAVGRGKPEPDKPAVSGKPAPVEVKGQVEVKDKPTPTPDKPAPVTVAEPAKVTVAEPTVKSDKPEVTTDTFGAAGAAAAINGAGSELANALRQKAGEIAGIKIQAPSQLPPGREGTEGIATEQAGGGLLHGAGTGTSDDIPIMASAGEFVVTASGSNLKDAIAHFGMRGFAEGGEVKGDLGSWAAIIKSTQWGAWLAKMGLPALGVVVPAAADVALGYANPAISAMLALKAVWDETHDHPPMTLGEVLREQRGGLSVNETMAKHFAETRQATFDERFPATDQEKQAAFDDRFGYATGGPIKRIDNPFNPPSGPTDDYDQWVADHKVAPNRSDWNELKAAGIDPKTAFDAQGNMTTAAAAMLVVKRGGGAKSSKAAAAATAAGSLATSTTQPYSSGVRFAPGQKPDQKLSDDEVRKQLFERGYTVPKDAIVKRNPFSPDNSYVIQYPNKGPTVLIPPGGSVGTAGAPGTPPGFTPGVLAVPSGTQQPAQRPGEKKEDYDERVQQWLEIQSRAAQQRGEPIRDPQGRPIPIEKQTQDTGLSLMSPKELRDKLAATAEGKKLLEQTQAQPEPTPLPRPRPEEAPGPTIPIDEVPLPRPRPAEADVTPADPIMDLLQKIAPRSEPKPPTLEEIQQQNIEPSTPEQRTIDPNQFRGEGPSDSSRDFAAADAAAEEEKRRQAEAEREREQDTAATGGLVTRFGMAEGGSVDERAYADPRGEGATDERSFAESRRRGMESRISAADFARLQRQRRGFAEGGPVGNEAGAISKSGGAVSEAEFAQLSRAAVPDQFVQNAMADLSRRMVQGFTEPITANYHSATAEMMRGGGGGGMPSGYHQLDLVTPAGRFQAAVSENTIMNIQRSSLGDKMVQTGPRPTWYS